MTTLGEFVFEAFTGSFQNVELLALIIILGFAWIMFANRLSAGASMIIGLILFLGIANFFLSPLITSTYLFLLAIAGIVFGMVLIGYLGRAR